MICIITAGVTLADGTALSPAEVTALSPDGLTVRVVLKQGVYHQIKRMFGVYGAGVNGLHRDAIGGPYFITDAHTFGCGVILMNADKWNGFNDAEKGWIKEAALAARSACYEYNQKQEQACFDSFADKGITKLEVSDIEKWQEACAGT